MAIALVQSNEGTSSTATTNPSFSTAPASGNLIVLNFVADDYNGTPDSGWTQSTGMEQQTFHGGYCWWRISNGSNPPGGYTIGSATVSAWILTEWSGCDATPYDISAGQFQQTSTSSYTTPSITPSSGDRLLVAGLGGSRASANNDPLTSWTNSFTSIRDIGTTTGGTNDVIGVAYQLVTANGSTAYSTGATFGGVVQQSKSGLIIAFKAAAGGTASGTLATTEATDTAAFAGNTVDSGTLATTEAADVAAFAGNTVVSGTLATTEAADTAAFAGAFSDQGTLAATEGTDTAAFAGGISDQGTLAVTEAADVAAFAGGGIVSGTLAATEATDIAAFSAAFDTEGALAATEAADVAAFAANTADAGTLAATETTDTASFSGAISDQASFAITEAADVAAFSGNYIVSGTLAATEASDVISFIGAGAVLRKRRPTLFMSNLGRMMGS